MGFRPLPMATIAPAQEVRVAEPIASPKRLLTALEVLLVYAGVLLYIWRWQSTHPRIWMVLVAAILASHLAHRDRLRDLGLLSTELRANAGLVLVLALALYVPLIVYGLASRRLALIHPSARAYASFGGYFIWCAFQQYLAQSYFHRRLMAVARSPHVSSALVALMFGAAHIPNPILMAVTTVGGFLLSEIYARHRNIWPLALAQAVGGILIAGLSPPSLMHNMRVGPGYFYYRVR